MSSIVALLYIWEECIKVSRETLPATLAPVVDSMLAEMGGLGFIGLFLGVVVTGGPLGQVVADLSEHYLGNEEILLESFEFLHDAFFEVGVGFFVVSGLTVAKVLKRLESFELVSRAALEPEGDEQACLSDLADILQVAMLDVGMDCSGTLTADEILGALRKIPRNTMWDEISISAQQVKAEALVVREQLIGVCGVDPNFRIENYFAKVSAHHLEDIVELSPLTWLPLIPLLSLGRSVDMSRDVISAASTNSFESCGYFLGTPSMFVSSTLLTALACTWGVWNFWKMTAVKEMLVPQLVRNSKEGGKPILLPPRYQDTVLLEEFNSSPYLVEAIESFFGRPPRNRQERLFGKAGAAGPEIYLKSIKFHMWLVVSQIIFWGGQIVARDAFALLGGYEGGNPELLVPELVIYSLYVGLAIGQLAIIPSTFLNYCLVTSIEELVQEETVQESCSAVCVLDDTRGSRRVQAMKEF
jgi:hypothetical protein